MAGNQVLASIHERIGILDSYPTHELALALRQNSKGLHELNFGGIEQVTDEVVHVLVEALSKDVSETSSIEYASFAGCTHLTDYGIYLLARTCKSLKKVVLDGCVNVTERGLHYLLSECQNLEIIDANGSNISAAPSVKADLKLSVLGCPIFNDMRNVETQASSDEQPERKIVIFCDASLQVDVAAYLHGSKAGQIIKQEVEAASMKYTHELENVIYQFHGTEDPTPFITEGSVFVYAFDADNNVGNPQIEIMSKLEAVRGQLLSAPYIVLIFHMGTKESMDEVEEVLSTLSSAVGYRETFNNKIREREKVKENQERDFLFQKQYMRGLQADEFHRMDPFYVFIIDKNKNIVENRSLAETKSTGASSSTSLQAEMEKMMEEWLAVCGENAMASLQSIKKSDISELISMASPPQLVMEVASGMLVLFKQAKSLAEGDWRIFKKFMRNMNFVTTASESLSQVDKLSSYNAECQKIKALMENPEMTEDNLQKRSRAIVIFFSWMKAVYVYNMEYWPRIKVIQASIKAKTQMEEKKDFSALENCLKSCAEFIADIQPLRTSALEKKVENLMSLPEAKVLTFSDYMQGLAEKQFGDDSGPYQKALQFLASRGTILFYPNIPGQPIIFNIQWFMDVLSLKPDNPTLENRDRVLSLPRYTHLFKKDDLLQALKGICSEMEFLAIFPIMRHFGIILEVPTDATKHMDPDCFFVYYRELPSKMYLWANPRQGQLNGLGEEVHNSYRPDDTLGIVSNYYHVKHFWPDNKLETDVSLQYSYNFDDGYPLALFPQILLKIYEMCDVRFCSSYSVVVGQGAVEAMVKCNIHGTRITNSIDIEARCTKFDVDQQPTEYVIHQYMWGLVNRICLCIESVVISYPFLHTHITIPCLGACSSTVHRYNYSPLEIKKDNNRDIFCPNCKDQQMSVLSYGLVRGRHSYLPFHDWQDRVGKVTCHHCGASKEENEKLWAMESSLYPTFYSQTFNVITAVSQPENETEKSESSGLLIYQSKQHLNPDDFNRVNVQVLEPVGVEMHVIGNLDCFNSLKQGNTSGFYTELKKAADSSLSYTVGELVTTINGEQQNEVVPCLQLSIGDELVVAVTNVIDESGWKTDELMLSVSKNGMPAGSWNIARERYLVLTTIGDATKLQQSPNIIVRTPDIPVTTARHHTVNSAVLYKTGRGMQWAVGIIESIRDGYLNIFQDASDSSSVLRLAPNSEDLLPICIAPGDMNITIENEVLKNSDQIYKYLNRTRTMPAPVGLFKASIRKRTDIHPLPVKGRLKAHPKRCTAGIYTSGVLANTMKYGISSLNPLPLEGVLFLPSEIETHHMYHPSRYQVQDIAKQAVASVCQGDVVYLSRDVSHCGHLMNMSGIPIAEIDDITAEDTSVIWKTKARSYLEEYESMLQFPLLFKVWDKLFPGVKVDFEENLMELCLSKFLSLYHATFLLLVTMNSEIQTLVSDFHHKDAMKFSTKISKALKENKEQGCPTHQSVDWKMIPNKEELRAIKPAPGAGMDVITEMLQHGRNLLSVNLTGCHIAVLPGIENCKSLQYLNISENEFVELPAELRKLRSTLICLIAHTNPLRELPEFLAHFAKLESLNVGNTPLRCLPESICDLPALQGLNIDRTCISHLPKKFGNLRYLEFLNFQGCPWIAGTDMPHRSMPLEKFITLVGNKNRNYNLAVLDKQAKEDLYNACDHKDGSFTSKGTYQMQKMMFDLFPRLGVDGDESDNVCFGGIPPQIFNCQNLTRLKFSNQGLKFIPDMIGKLTKLKELVLIDNPELHTISAEVAKTEMEGLSLNSCPALKTPPQEIVKQNNPKLNVAYLRRLASASVTCYRTKLMLVGLGEAGKTSLIRALMSGSNKTSDTAVEGITDGIDIQSWQVNQGNQILTFSVWDFAGQTVYYNTHQFFLSKRAIYILVWNMRLGFEHAGLDFWLNSIQCHAPETPVFIVGTHADQVSRSELPSESIKRKFPNITGFFYLSSKTGQGVEEFNKKLIDTTFQQPYMGERIPEAWFNLEKNIISRRQKSSLLLWEEIISEAERSGVFGDEIKQAIQFLHDLGSLQHFDNDFLRNRVVINPQWIVDVMACVVSVHNDVSRNGYLDHKDIEVIWKDYPSELHDWLLRLTELFDLTFPLSDEDVNIVPCLLPHTEPEVTWPPMSDGMKKGEMLYRFESLPAGLFNRAQVRLCQFSDGSNMWKRGSVLKKNDHMAVISMQGESEILVRAQGTRPENVLLLVHEVFEGLILEFFRGVKYEYLMPCRDCLKANAKEPSMFPSAVLRRAVDLKAMHLQCHALFHSLAISEVQAMMPPEASEDYEIHMSNMVHDLEDLQNQLPFDTCILYCKADVPQDKAGGVHPKQLKEDLEKKGFTVWYQDNLDSAKVDDVMKAMSLSKTVITFVSDTFVLDLDCQRMFQFAQESLRKPILLVMTGKGRKWQQSFIGMKTAHQVYVNMQRVNQYQSKLQELVAQMTGKVGKKKVVKGADVFLSYCWTNSAKAVAVGHAVEKAGSLGHGDPRQLKEFLEKECGFSAWIDFENVGVNGLFSDIAESLKKCKVVVACVSDEYALSPNCQMEFRFAHITLKKPVILVVVGTGYNWESTEVGLLALGYPKINFQVANNLAYDQLREIIAESLACMDDKVANKGVSEGSQKQSAFQELYELAQRKFIRQLIGYTENCSAFPRLFVLDLQDAENPADDAELPVDCIEVDIAQDKTNDVKQCGPGEYCFRILCEHEGGWHSVHDGYPLQMIQEEVMPLLKLTAPFFARMLSILKHSNVNLHCLNSARGDVFIKILEQNAGVNVDIKQFYLAIRNHIMKKDGQNSFGGLARCYLPSGKFLWLCPEHQKLPRVSKMDVVLPESGHQENISDYELVECLQVYEDLIQIKPQGEVKGPETPQKINQEPKEQVGRPAKPPLPQDAKIKEPAPSSKPTKSSSEDSLPKPAPSTKSHDTKSPGLKPPVESTSGKPKSTRSKSVACTIQ